MNTAEFSKLRGSTRMAIVIADPNQLPDHLVKQDKELVDFTKTLWNTLKDSTGIYTIKQNPGKYLKLVLAITKYKSQSELFNETISQTVASIVTLCNDRLISMGAFPTSIFYLTDIITTSNISFTGHTFSESFDILIEYADSLDMKAKDWRDVSLDDKIADSIFEYSYSIAIDDPDAKVVDLARVRLKEMKSFECANRILENPQEYYKLAMILTKRSIRNRGLRNKECKGLKDITELCKQLLVKLEVYSSVVKKITDILNKIEINCKDKSNFQVLEELIKLSATIEDTGLTSKVVLGLKRFKALTSYVIYLAEQEGSETLVVLDKVKFIELYTYYLESLDLSDEVLDNIKDVLDYNYHMVKSSTFSDALRLLMEKTEMPKPINKIVDCNTLASLPDSCLKTVNTASDLLELLDTMDLWTIQQ